MTSIFYLSFATEEEWLGGAYTRAEGDGEALTKSHVLGFNPGGEVKIIGPMSEENDVPGGKFPDEKLDVLLDREGIEL